MGRDTLEAALWAFYYTSTFEEDVLRVVNLGDDADTTGAFYGQHGIPEDWVKKIAMKK